MSDENGESLKYLMNEALEHSNSLCEFLIKVDGQGISDVVDDALPALLTNTYPDAEFSQALKDKFLSDEHKCVVGDLFIEKFVRSAAEHRGLVIVDLGVVRRARLHDRVTKNEFDQTLNYYNGLGNASEYKRTNLTGAVELLLEYYERP